MLAPLASVSVSFGMGILQRSHQMNGTVNLPVSPGLSVQQRGLSILMFIKKVTRLSFVLQTLICEICMERMCICTYTYMWTCICTYTYMWQFFITNLRWALSPLEKRRHEVKVTRDGCWEIRWTSAALQTTATAFTGPLLHWRRNEVPWSNGTCAASPSCGPELGSFIRMVCFLALAFSGREYGSLPLHVCTNDS